MVMTAGGPPRRERLDWPPPRVVADDGGAFPGAHAAEAARRAVEQLVNEVWAQVGRPSRAVLARGVGGIKVRADVNIAKHVLWEGDLIVLYVPADVGSHAWRTEIRRLLGAAFARTFWQVHAGLLAGGNAAPGDGPGERPGAPSTLWLTAFQTEAWDEETWALATALVFALYDLWGIPPSKTGYGVLVPTFIPRPPNVDPTPP
jgi:hypothetical protein